MKLIIEDDEGHKTTVPFVRDEITVGRQEGNTIRLTERNVSRRHARFYRRDGAVWVEDLKSYNGIRINGDRIEGAAQLRDGDLVQIGDFDLAVQPDAERAAPAPSRTEQMPAVDLSSLPTASGLSDAERDPSAPPPALSRREATSVIRVPPATPAARPQAPAGGFEAEEVGADQAPRLVITTTELAGREFACVRTVLTVGRGDECDIVINHRSLSRAHCRIFRASDGTWKVADLGSSNRVQVNDEEYAESALRSGDVIGLGHVKLRFVAPGEDFVFEGEGRRRSSMVPIFVGAGLLAAALGGVTVFYLQSKKKQPPSAPPAVALPTEVPPAPKAAPVPDAVPPPVPPAAAPAAPAQPRPPPPDEVKLADEEDPATKQINEASARAEELVRKHDLKGAQRVLAAVKSPGSNVAYENALRHVNGELENLKLVTEWSAPRKVPAGAALERLRLLATDDRSIYREAAAQLVARADKQAAARPREVVKHPSEPRAPVPDEVKPPVPVASAADDMAKRAAQLNTEALRLNREGDPEGAVVAASQAVSLDASKADYLYNLATFYAMSQKVGESAQAYRQFLKSFPNDSRCASIRETLKSYDNTTSN